MIVVAIPEHEITWEAANTHGPPRVRSDRRNGSRPRRPPAISRFTAVLVRSTWSCVSERMPISIRMITFHVVVARPARTARQPVHLIAGMVRSQRAEVNHRRRRPPPRRPPPSRGYDRSSRNPRSGAGQNAGLEARLTTRDRNLDIVARASRISYRYVATGFTRFESSHPVPGDRVRGRRVEIADRGKYPIRPRSSLLRVGEVLSRFFPRRAGRCLVATATRSRSKRKKTHVRSSIQSDHLRESRLSALDARRARAGAAGRSRATNGGAGSPAVRAFRSAGSRRGQHVSDQEASP